VKDLGNLERFKMRGTKPEGCDEIFGSESVIGL
jgi:hypothetical protein